MTQFPSPDIDETILAALTRIFTLELITNLKAQGDPLYLNRLTQADLQDDPTQVAPYLTYRPDIDKGVIPVFGELEKQYGGPEIGGPIRHVHYYDGTYGIGLCSTRATARTNIAILSTRVQQVLMKYYDLSGILVAGAALESPDQSKVIEGANPYLVDKTTTRIFGGDGTFYGTGRIYWHYPVAWYQTYNVNFH